MGITIRKSGVMTTVQDMGRWGWRADGVSPSGAVDVRALRMGNLLLENNSNAAGLEFTLAGPEIRFTTNTVIAITGGDFQPTLNDKPVPLYTALAVKQGDIVTFRSAKQGAFGYVAFAGGGLDTPLDRGSRATDLAAGIGGLEGRVLEPCDYIPFVTKAVDFLPNLASHSMPYDSIYEMDCEEITLRVVLGPHEDAFSMATMNTFLNESFVITDDCNRGYYLLEGTPLKPKPKTTIVDSGTTFGNIAVTENGQLMVMLADRPTVSSLPRIGAISTVDLPKMVQRMPGARVRFVPITIRESQDLLRAQLAELKRLQRLTKRLSADNVSPRRTARRLSPILEHQARISENEQLWIDGPSMRKDRAMQIKEG